MRKVYPKDLQFPLHFPNFQLQQYNDQTYISAPSLKLLSENKEQKKELRTKTVDELIKELRDLRAEVAKLKIDMKIGKVENEKCSQEKHNDV